MDQQLGAATCIQDAMHTAPACTAPAPPLAHHPLAPLAPGRELRPKFITPLEAEELLRRLWQREWQLLTLIFGPGGAQWEGGGGEGGSRRVITRMTLSHTPLHPAFCTGGTALLGGKRGAALEGRRTGMAGMRIVDHWRGGAGRGRHGKAGLELQGPPPVWNGLSVQWSKAMAATAVQGYRMFFLRVLPVAPNKFRPPSMVGGEM